MASDVEICNIAMHRLGQADISSLTEGTKRAALCNSTYSRVLDEMLTRYVWSFSRARVSLAPSATAPAFTDDFTFAFDLPAGYLRMESMSDYNVDYLIEGGQILSNSNPLSLRYVKRITDPNLMTPLFRKALGLQIAIDLCKPITGDLTLKKELEDELKDVLAEARTADAQSEGEGIPPPDTWIAARG